MKKAKKLTLSKETVRALGDLSRIGGGGGSDISNCPSCIFTCPREFTASECTNCSDWC